MGCGPSVPQGPSRRRRVHDLALEELAPVRPGMRVQQHTTPFPELTAAELLNALQTTAAFIAHRKQSVTIIVVGGAVNTIFLRSRKTTHDIDFFNEFITAKESKVLREAVDYARIQSNGRLTEDWFNNRTIYFIPPNLRQELTRNAIKQNVVVFETKGLKLLAAPWSYAFCSKLDRVSGGAPRPYDLQDTVMYLQQVLIKNGASFISYENIQQWIAKYRTHGTIDDLRRVNQAYRQTFGRDAIRF